MATVKSRFVGVRLPPELQRKLIVLSEQAGDPGNMSAGLRWALDQVRVNGSIAIEAQQSIGGQQREAVQHA